MKIRNLLLILLFALPHLVKGQKIQLNYNQLWYLPSSSMDTVLPEFVATDSTMYRLFNQACDPANNSGHFTPGADSISNGGVTSISILSGGEGYSSAPAMTFVSNNAEGQGGSGASVTVTVSGGAITSFAITPGSNYSSPPGYTLSGGGGSGAVLQPQVKTSYPYEGFNFAQNYPMYGFFDLGAPYVFDSAAYYGVFGGDTVRVFSGTPYVWDTMFNGNNDVSYHGWKYHDAATDGTRRLLYNGFPDTTQFLKIMVNKNLRISQMVFYGHKVSGTLPNTTPSHPPTYSKVTYGQQSGIDDYLTNWPALTDKQPFLGYNERNYENISYIDTNTSHTVSAWKFVVDKYSQSPTTYTGQIFNKNVASTGYTFYPNTTDSSYYYAKNNSKDRWYAMVGAWQGFNGNLFIDSSQSPLYNTNGDSSNSSYRMAVTAFQMALITSTNTTDTSLEKVSYPSVATYAGKGVADRYETGNETDGLPWTPVQLAAYESAMYNGGGQFNNAGFKTACPSCTVVNFGTYYEDTTYYRYVLWYGYFFNHGVVPLDATNFHDYRFNGIRALSPFEADTHGEDMYQRDTPFVHRSHLLYPGKPVYKTEDGQGSSSVIQGNQQVQSVPRIPGVDSSVEQADWYAWEGIVDMAAGLSVHTPYADRNDQTAFGGDSVNNSTEVYASHGWMTDSVTGPAFHINLFTKPAYWYMKQVDSLLHSYYFDSIIRTEQSDSVEIYRFVSSNNSDSVIYVVGLGTITNSTLSSYKVFLNNIPPSSAITLVNLANSATGPSWTGTYSSATDNSYTIGTVTEAPLFLKAYIPPPTVTRTIRINANILRNRP
jgi:hypothetical protein